jgi:hypothetical protein
MFVRSVVLGQKSEFSCNVLPNFLQYVSEWLETTSSNIGCHSERSAAKSRNLWAFHKTNLKSEMSRLRST